MKDWGKCKLILKTGEGRKGRSRKGAHCMATGA